MGHIYESPKHREKYTGNNRSMEIIIHVKVEQKLDLVALEKLYYFFTLRFAENIMCLGKALHSEREFRSCCIMLHIRTWTGGEIQGQD